jgi:hypothetical protein
MSANHQLFVFRASRLEIRARIAIRTNSVRNVLIFVHGFCGHADDTWESFQSLIGHESGDKWRNTDMFFIGYSSLRRSLADTSWDLLEFLEDLLNAPHSKMHEWTESPALQSVRPPNSYEYLNLTLVGHSMGGLVIRKAVVDCLKDLPNGPQDSFEKILTNANVLLYAPALWGMQMSGLKGVAWDLAGIQTWARMMTGGISSIKEVQPGSPILQSTREATEELAAKPGAAPSLVAHIAWADNDKVIANLNTYRTDPSGVRIVGSTHLSVCKPHSVSGQTFQLLDCRIV